MMKFLRKIISLLFELIRKIGKLVQKGLFFLYEKLLVPYFGRKSFLGKAFLHTYYCILRFFLVFDSCIYRVNINKFDVDTHDLSEMQQKPIINELFDPQLIIRQGNILPDVNVNRAENFDFRNIVIRHEEPIYHQIKWNSTKVNFIISSRKYSLDLASQVKLKQILDLKITKKLKTSAIPKKEIDINLKLTVTEEMIALAPYIRAFSKKKMFSFPVIKRPVYKSYFSKEETDFFREKLAKVGKTKRTNIELINIYDKFNRELYSSIKQDAETGNIVCYLSDKNPQTTDDKFQYLIIGKKRDDNTMVNTLTALEKEVIS